MRETKGAERERWRKNERERRVHEQKIHFKLLEIDKPANRESIHEENEKNETTMYTQSKQSD